MGAEIEAKMKVESLEVIRARLKKGGGKFKRRELETNIFFDTDDAALKGADKGLRLRIAKDLKTSKEAFIITMKGPLQKGKLKVRDETEFNVDDPKAVSELFENLGFKRQLSFEKKRESWGYKGCKVELDEVALLGTYVEIEGPSQQKVMAARKSLGLKNLALIQTGYISMLAKYLGEHRIKSKEIKLGKRKAVG
jgi:predicted adenylyl cyclase CyaB